MINAERLQDAIGLLPEDMLAPVDALRRQKRLIWKPIAAVAASLLLVVGLYYFQPAQKAADNGAFLEDAAENAPAGRGDGFAGNSSYSEYASDSLYPYCLNAIVTEITKDYWVVALQESGTAKVFLENAEKPSQISLGAEIILWFDQEPANLQQLYPEQITTK